MQEVCADVMENIIQKSSGVHSCIPANLPGTVIYFLHIINTYSSAVLYDFCRSSPQCPADRGDTGIFPAGIRNPWAKRKPAAPRFLRGSLAAGIFLRKIIAKKIEKRY